MPWMKFTYWAHGIRFEIVHGRSPAMSPKVSYKFKDGKPVSMHIEHAPAVNKFVAYRNGKWFWVDPKLKELKRVLNRAALKELRRADK